MIHILYVEDEKEIGEWVKQELQGAGYQVDWFLSEEGIEDVLGLTDFALLDVMLPGIDGFTLGKRIKEQYPDMPILMLTARTAVEDKVYGLSFADDYMVKPFHPKELVARIEVLLRRRGTNQQDRLQLDYIEVDLHTKQLRNVHTNEEIILTGKQYKIFFYLVQHLGQILTKEQIYEAVWNEPYMEGDKTLMVHMRYLREKIEQDASSPAIIQTIRGIGYRIKS